MFDSRKQGKNRFFVPFKKQIRNDLLGTCKTVPGTDRDILNHFRKRAITTLKDYQFYRDDLSYPFTHGIESWETKLDAKWFQVSQAFKLYLEVRHRMQ